MSKRLAMEGSDDSGARKMKRDDVVSVDQGQQQDKLIEPHLSTTSDDDDEYDDGRIVNKKVCSTVYIN